MRNVVIKQIYLTNILRELLVNHLTWMTNYETYSKCFTNIEYQCLITNDELKFTECLTHIEQVKILRTLI